jgi:hypothetical protein
MAVPDLGGSSTDGRVVEYGDGRPAVSAAAMS